MKCCRLAPRLSFFSLCISNLRFQQSHHPKIPAITMFSSLSNGPQNEVPVTKHCNEFLKLDSDLAPPSQELSSYSLIMLNSATMDINIVKKLWGYCDYKICADGGANRLFDNMPSDSVGRFVPGIVYYLVRAEKLGNDSDLSLRINAV